MSDAPKGTTEVFHYPPTRLHGVAPSLASSATQIIMKTWNGLTPVSQSPTLSLVHRSDIDKKDDEVMQNWRTAYDPRENSTVLFSHFHALWKARLVAFKLFALTVRCFGPHNSIGSYEGEKAHFQRSAQQRDFVLRKVCV